MQIGKQNCPIIKQTMVTPPKIKYCFSGMFVYKAEHTFILKDISSCSPPVSSSCYLPCKSHVGMLNPRLHKQVTVQTLCPRSSVESDHSSSNPISLEKRCISWILNYKINTLSYITEVKCVMKLKWLNDVSDNFSFCPDYLVNEW